jgi:hypothetical protein
MAPDSQMTYSFSTPSVPPSLNKYLRMHYRTKKKLKVAWQNEFYALDRRGFQLLTACAQAQRKMRMTITIHNARQYDRDNSFGACKVIVDATKAVGLIHDDREEFLDLCVKQEPSTRKERHTTVEIGPA